MYPIAEFLNPDHFRVESVIACILAEGCLQSFFKSDQLVEGGEVINFAFMGDLVMSIDWFEVYNQGVSIGYVLGGGWGCVNGVPFDPSGVFWLVYSEICHYLSGFG